MCEYVRIMSCVADCMTLSAGRDSNVVLVSFARLLQASRRVEVCHLLSNGPCKPAWLLWAPLAWHSCFGL